MQKYGKKQPDIVTEPEIKPDLPKPGDLDDFIFNDEDVKYQSER